MGWRIRGSNAGASRIFRTRLDWPWGSSILIHKGYRVSFPGVRRPGRGFNHPPLSRVEVKERVELYLYSRYGPSWPVLGRNFHVAFYPKSEYLTK